MQYPAIESGSLIAATPWCRGDKLSTQVGTTNTGFRVLGLGSEGISNDGEVGTGGGRPESYIRNPERQHLLSPATARNHGQNWCDDAKRIAANPHDSFLIEPA